MDKSNVHSLHFRRADHVHEMVDNSHVTFMAARVAIEASGLLYRDPVDVITHHAGPQLGPVPRQVFDSMEDATSTVPFAVVPIFDTSLRAVAVYVSPSGTRRTMVFVYDSVTYTTLQALGNAMLANWRAAQSRSSGFPPNFTAKLLTTSAWLLVRCGAHVLTLARAKQVGLLCTGGSFLGHPRPLQLQPAAAALPLNVPFDIHLRGRPDVGGAVVLVHAQLRHKHQRAKHRLTPLTAATLAGGDGYVNHSYVFAIGGRFYTSAEAAVVALTLLARLLGEFDESTDASAASIAADGARTSSSDASDDQSHVAPARRQRAGMPGTKRLVVTCLGITLQQAQYRGAFSMLYC